MMMMVGVFLLTWIGMYMFHGLLRFDQVAVHGSRLVLAAVFAYLTFNELHTMLLLHAPNNNNDNNDDTDITTEELLLSSSSSSTTSTQGMTKIIQTACVALMGVLATGTFQKQVDDKQRLAKLVDERTREIRQQADTLRMVNLALQASDTAVAITTTSTTTTTDKDADDDDDDDENYLSIVWCNAALEELVSGVPKKKKHHHHHHHNNNNNKNGLLGQSLLEALLVQYGNEKTAEQLQRAFFSCGRPSWQQQRQQQLSSRGDYVGPTNLFPRNFSLSQ